MATPNYAFAKRQRDIEKKKKKEEKQQRKNAAPAAEEGQPAEPGTDEQAKPEG